VKVELNRCDFCCCIFFLVTIDPKDIKLGKKEVALYGEVHGNSCPILFDMV